MSTQALYQPTLANLKYPADTQSVNQALLIMNQNLNKVANAASGQVITPLTAQISSNVLYTVPSNAGIYDIYIPVAFMKASSGGPYIVTLTTGTANSTTVVLPIAKSGDTLLSGALFLPIYVDAAGNVTSGDWSVSGSNSNGTWVKYANGIINQYGSDIKNDGLTTVQLFTFPVTFAITLDSIEVQQYGGSTSSWALQGSVPTLSTFGVIIYATNGAGAINASRPFFWSATGEWK